MFLEEGIQFSRSLSQESGVSLPPNDDNLEEDSSEGMEEMLTNVRPRIKGVAGVFMKNPENRKTLTS